MELRHYISLAVRWWWLLLLLTAVAAAGGYWTSQQEDPIYRATTTVMIGQPTQATDASELKTLEQLALTYADLALRQPVLQGVAETLGMSSDWQKLKKRVDAKLVLGTQLLEITARGDSPDEAQQIANEVANQLQQLSPNSRRLPGSVTVIESAQVNISLPSVMSDTMLAAAVGLALALSIVLLIEYLDNTFRSAEEIGSEVTLLGAIGRTNGRKPADRLVTAREPTSPITDSYCMIRSNINFAARSRMLKSIVVTSPIPGDGKSTVASNLATVMARAGFLTLLVDSDLRQPALHRIFQVSNDWGLGDLLYDPSPDFWDHLQGSQIDNLQLFIQDTHVENLRLLPSGPPIPASASELLGSPHMQQLVKHLTNAFDIVIFDSPPVLTAADASLLAHQVEGVVLVVKAGQTRRDAMKQAMDSLQRADANVLGAVLNQVSIQNSGYYFY